MCVLVEDAAESRVSLDVEAGDQRRILDRSGQRLEGPGVHEALMRPVLVVDVLELA
jgi:hypothetical protein